MKATINISVGSKRDLVRILEWIILQIKKYDKNHFEDTGAMGSFKVEIEE